MSDPATTRLIMFTYAVVAIFVINAIVAVHMKRRDARRAYRAASALEPRRPPRPNPFHLLITFLATAALGTMAWFGFIEERVCIAAGNAPAGQVSKQFITYYLQHHTGAMLGAAIWRYNDHTRRGRRAL
jgi:hypothetical protein